MLNIRELDNCPECACEWKGADIYQFFLEQKNNPSADQHDYYKDLSDEQIYDIAGFYGYTHEEPRYFRHLIGIELAQDHPQHYDGTSYYMCPGCKVTWNRFSGEKEEILSMEAACAVPYRG